MLVYMIAVICAVAVSGIILLIVFHRLKVLNFRTVASITLASLITAIIMPVIFSALSGGDTEKADPTVLIMVTIGAFIAYVIIVLILSILISLIVPKIKTRKNDKKPAKKDKKDTDEGKADGGAREKSVLEQIGALYFMSDKAKEDKDSEAETAASAQGQEEDVSSGDPALDKQEPAVSAGGDEPAGTAADTGKMPETADAAVAEITEVMAAVDQTGQSTEEPNEEYALDAELYSLASSDLDPADDMIASEAADHDADIAQEETAYTDGQLIGADTGQNTDNVADSAVETQEHPVAGDSYIEQIYLNYVAHGDEKTDLQENDSEITDVIAGNTEKSVDSEEIIDKMGIENKVHDSEAMTIGECITEAFRLKEAGDFEGAILNFMYALDKKPPKELTFWIIIDICVMYKSLGQQDLALEILNSYYDIYGDMMDDQTRDGIIRSLTDTSA